MQRYLAEREALIRDAVPGEDPARRLARLTDEALCELVEASPHKPRKRWALVALGGYGSGRLYPASDLDLLIVSDEGPARLKPFVESVLYPLWDSGLKVGHQVRSPRDQLRACREDITTLTAALSARTLAGDRTIGDAVAGACAKDAQKRSRAVLAEFRRRERPGSPYLLEPDLKDGAGGRRDFDELVWTSCVLSGSRCDTPAHLVDAGALSPQDLQRAELAAGFVSEARWHVQAAGHALGPVPAELIGELPEHGEALQRALADTAHTLDAARAVLAGEALPDPPAAADVVLELLARGPEALPELERAAWTGALDDLVSGYSALMTTRRPGLNHRYTVGAHSLRAAAALAEIASSAGGSLARSAASVEDLPALRIACLTHDVGKRSSGADHARLGAEPAHDAALAFGLRPSRAQVVADLVRHHLVLIEVATRDDIDDEDVVLSTAMRIGRRELVAPLHLLTVADSRATGPEAWGPWQEALVGTLVTRLDAALSPDVDGAGLAARAEGVRAEALADADGDDVASFVRSASLRYLAGRSPAEVLAHGRLVAAFARDPRPDGFRVHVRPGPAPGSYDVAVAAKDRPELFARIAGALALAGLDILGAEASGTHAGSALDIFTVRSATLATPDTETWPRFERYLQAALADRLELAVRLRERRHHYPHHADVDVRVDFDRSSGYGTTVTVIAPDRVGLLHELASAISATGLDIRWAKAVTAEGVVRDTFLVSGPDGGPVDDPGVLGHLSMRLRQSV